MDVELKCLDIHFLFSVSKTLKAPFANECNNYFILLSIYVVLTSATQVR